LSNALKDYLDLLSNSSRLAFGPASVRQNFDLAGVIAAPNAEDRAPLGHDVGKCEILGQTQRVPHRRDVEARSDFRVLGEWQR
jgi:hypothetical protein